MARGSALAAPRWVWWWAAAVAVAAMAAAVSTAQAAAATAARTKSAIQPMRALDVARYVPEPSGLAYSAATRRLYANCDRCHYLSEMDELGAYRRHLAFSSAHKDVEAVAVDDASCRIYIASEGKREITYFALDDYRSSGAHTAYLRELGSFRVQTAGTTSHRSGLEGMTVLGNTNLMVANEKGPRLLLNVTRDGELVSTVKPSYPKDISGLAYDAALDLLWVLSDQSEAVFLTDLTGLNVLDQWDLPCKNPEGIAVNNDHDPPLLYVTTDPSAPAGPQYVSLLLVFVKPERGSGLSYHHHVRPSAAASPCKGCRHVCAVVEAAGHHCELEVDPADHWEQDGGRSFTPLWSERWFIAVVSTAAAATSCCALLGCAAAAVAVRRRWRRASPFRAADFERVDGGTELERLDGRGDAALAGGGAGDDESEPVLGAGELELHDGERGDEEETERG